MNDLLDPDFFSRNTLTVAQDLLGVKLTYGECEGIIVETEAYRDDAASHYITRPRFGRMLRDTYGCIYIYFVYGMHHCLNFTTEKNGTGAVLIRAVEPVRGFSVMKERRATEVTSNLTNGPGKLFQAFAFDPHLHGEKVGISVQLTRAAFVPEDEIVRSPRIGVSKAQDLLWRFYVKENKFVS